MVNAGEKYYQYDKKPNYIYELIAIIILIVFLGMTTAHIFNRANGLTLSDYDGEQVYSVNVAPYKNSTYETIMSLRESGQFKSYIFIFNYKQLISDIIQISGMDKECDVAISSEAYIYDGYYHKYDVFRNMDNGNVVIVFYSFVNEFDEEFNSVSIELNKEDMTIFMKKLTEVMRS